jgi:hypothetical protein
MFGEYRPNRDGKRHGLNVRFQRSATATPATNPTAKVNGDARRLTAVATRVAIRQVLMTSAVPRAPFRAVPVRLAFAPTNRTHAPA